MARLAYSLATLRNQVNQAYPNRNKASDGWLGDAAHRAVASDHNENSAGVVCALDLTHDPAHGFDAHKTADTLLANRHPNLKYLISNRRIAGDWTGWKWINYSGSNPHDKHIHISVGSGGEGTSRAGTYDDTTNWNIGGDEVFKTHAEIEQAYLAVYNRKPETVAVKDFWMGKKHQDFLNRATTEKEWHLQNDILLRAYPELVKKVSDLQTQLDKEQVSDKTQAVLSDMQAVVNKYKEQ